MIKINIKNEFSKLLFVLVGLADDFGGVPRLEDCYDPKSRENVKKGTFPSQKDCIQSINKLIGVLKKYDIQVFQPANIKGLNQIFSRDIAFVIQDKLVLSNIINERKKELDAIDFVLNQIDDSDIIRIPSCSRIEGGDVIICNEYVFVGYSESEDFDKYTVSRTNKAGLNFLIENFPNIKVKGFELQKSDDNPTENALHLDCCFQPIGNGMAILCRYGFKNQEDVDFLINYFGSKNIIELSKEQMYDMNANIFSVSDKVIISEERFISLNADLRKRGFIVEEISYNQIGKMSGLLRCSTLPLIRQ